jgi:hypothetical protein
VFESIEKIRWAIEERKDELEVEEGLVTYV